MSGADLDNLREFELVALAARGSLPAQQRMTLLCMAKEQCGLSHLEAYACAEPFARMAASHGKAEDLVLLAGLLRSRAIDIWRTGDEARALRIMDELHSLFDNLALNFGSEGREMLTTLLTALADQGDEEAAIRLNRLMEIVPVDEAAKLCASVRSHVEEMVAMMGGGNA